MPVNAPCVVTAEVVWPPFDDVRPRTTPAQRRAEAEAAEERRKQRELEERKQKGALARALACLQPVSLRPPLPLSPRKAGPHLVTQARRPQASWE